MSTVLLLNGCGSSGKTSIAHSIQDISTELWLTFGVDTVIDMLPYRKEETYFTSTAGTNAQGNTMHIEATPRGQRVFGVMPDMAKLLADRHNNLIIDEVLFDDARLRAYAQALTEHTVYFIGVFCALKVMQEREILRRNRLIGLSNDQNDRVHKGLRPYDMTVDTTHASPFDCARKILSHIHNTPSAFLTHALS